MTIDERIEKIVERHEALTQTVELLAGERKPKIWFLQCSVWLHINWVDGLDRETSRQQNATQAQPEIQCEKEPLGSCYGFRRSW